MTGNLGRLAVATAACSAALVSGMLAAPARGADGKKVHLFILSGQSNMAGLKPEVSFTPAVTKAFSEDEVIVIKDAAGGQPIRRWYKKWKPSPGLRPGAASSPEQKLRGGAPPKSTGDLYDRLMGKVKRAIEGKTPATVSFVWMQGERDAREGHGEVYADSMKGLVEQLREDLKRKDVNFVIGRLSDYGNSNKSYRHWMMVRKAQVEVAEADPRGSWVDTDDLNGPRNGLHYTKEGYRKLGERFAEKAVELVRNPGKADEGKGAAAEKRRR